MRCPSCGAKGHVPGVSSACSRCIRPFVFNPKVDGVSDVQWQALLDSVSGKGTYHFTKNQLFATYCRQVLHRHRRRANKRFRSWAFFAAAASAIFTFNLPPTEAHTFEGIAIRVGLLGVLFWCLHRNNRDAGQAEAPRYADFEDLMARWQRVFPIPGLVTRPMLKEPPPKWRESDIYDYGLERLLIVDEERLVDLFVLNNLHAEQRCAIISSTGYPSYILPHLKKSLAARPNLPIFVLHSATLEGRKLAYQLKDLGLGIDTHPVTDLGWGSGDFFDLNRLQLFDADAWEGARAVDTLPPRQLQTLIASSMADSVPLSAYMGRDEAAGSWTESGDRLWVDVSSYG